MDAFRATRALCLVCGVLSASLAFTQEKQPEPLPKNASAEEFSKYAAKLREAAIAASEPRTSIPTTARPAKFGGAYQWRQDIVTTLFYVGQENRSSCWDPKWSEHFGGFDHPDAKKRLFENGDYRPRDFVPRLNPFYFALPYNDVEKKGTKAEARACIPWFGTAFVTEGTSVLRDRWIAVRRNGRIAYAQWSDCGPFRTNHWQYVFGNERPRPNDNGGAGLNVSPAVRDYLGLQSTDVTDWRFVEAREVPPGPWRRYGENNPFVQQARLNAKPDAKTPAPTAAPTQPTVKPNR